MKKFTKVIAIVLVLATLVCAFASCGKKLKGKYEATAFGTGTCLEFKGSKVMAQFKLLGSYGDAIEGEYKIKDGKITLTFKGDDKNAEALEGTFDFEEGDNYIKIGLIKYTKAE